MGHEAGNVEQLLRDRFDTDAVQAIFRRGGADGTAVMARLARETTADAGFADLPMPPSVLTADLSAQRPVLLTEDGVADALVAAMTVPGLYPPVRRGDQRLVDAVVLTPGPDRRAGRGRRHDRGQPAGPSSAAGVAGDTGAGASHARP